MEDTLKNDTELKFNATKSKICTDSSDSCDKIKLNSQDGFNLMAYNMTQTLIENNYSQALVKKAGSSPEYTFHLEAQRQFSEEYSKLHINTTDEQLKNLNNFSEKHLNLQINTTGKNLKDWQPFPQENSNAQTYGVGTCSITTQQLPEDCIKTQAYETTIRTKKPQSVVEVYSDIQTHITDTCSNSFQSLTEECSKLQTCITDNCSSSTQNLLEEYTKIQFSSNTGSVSRLCLNADQNFKDKDPNTQNCTTSNGSQISLSQDLEVECSLMQVSTEAIHPATFQKFAEEYTKMQTYNVPDFCSDATEIFSKEYSKILTDKITGIHAETSQNLLKNCTEIQTNNASIHLETSQLFSEEYAEVPQSGASSPLDPSQNSPETCFGIQTIMVHDGIDTEDNVELSTSEGSPTHLTFPGSENYSHVRRGTLEYNVLTPQM